MIARAINRRCFLGSLGVLAAGLLLPADFADPGVRRIHRPLMGTRVGIVAQGVHAAETDFAIQCAFDEMLRLEQLMSRYRECSDVGALQRAAGRHAVDVAPETMAVLERSRRVSALSGGAFDITTGAYAGWDFRPGAGVMPSPKKLEAQRALVDYRDVVLDTGRSRAYLRRPGMRIDLGGVAKLPILQAGLRVLQQHGIASAMIDGGGDVLTLGQLQGRPWRVGVRDPQHPGALLGTLQLNTGVVASSGDYERFFIREGHRYHHILDPRTGYSSEGVHGVTLVSGDGADLSGLGAAMMVAGAGPGRKLLADQPAVEALIVDAAGHLWLSAGMPLDPLKVSSRPV